MEKTVAVKLTARVSQYLSAMAAASKATTGLATSASGLTKVGSSMQSVGANMTRYVSVPLVALGGAATLMASRFETSFAQMVGLANVPAGEVDNLRESVLSLAGETAQAPQDLADALYFAASSGLDSAAAMDAVELAARAAAAGMGSTETVVGLLTGAVGSYGAANLTAAEAADILTSTVREGRAAPEELANSLGRVLPIAASMGISMNEVGGAIAFMTNKGLDADEAVTGLRNVLTHLAAPGTAAQHILEDMGTSFGELKAAIDQDGLMGALDLLREHGFNGNAQALHALMPDVRGLNTLTALLADNSGSLDTIMGRLNHTTGSLDTAFNAVASTSAFKMKQAFAEIQVALIEVGAVLLPFVASAAKAIGELAGWFSNLPAPIQQAAVAMGVLAAAGGPVLYIAGTIMKSWGLLNTAFGATLGSSSKAVSGLSAVAVAVGVAYAAWKILDEGHLNATGHIDASGDALLRTTDAAWQEMAAAAAAGDEVDTLAVAHQALGQAILEQADDRLSKWFSALNVSGDTALDTLINLREWGGSNAHAQEFLAHALGLTVEQMDMLSGIVHTGFKEGDITQEMRDGLGMTNEQIIAVGGALVGLQGYAIENTGELDDMARASLDAAVQLGGTRREAVLAAEAIAGSRLETGNAVDVYEEYVNQLELIDPAAADATAGVDALTASVEGSGAPIRTSTELWDGYWQGFTNVPKVLGTAIDGLEGVKETVVGTASEINTAAEATAALNEMASHGPAAEGWVQYAEIFADASRNGEDALAVYQALIGLLQRGAPAWAETVMGQLGLTSKGVRDLGKDTSYVADQFAKAGPPVKALGTAINGISGDKAVAGFQALGDAVTELGYAFSTELPTAADRFHFLQDAAGGLRDAFDALRTPHQQLRDSTRAVWKETAALTEMIEENGVELNEVGDDFSMATEEGRSMGEQLDSTAASWIEHGAAMVANGQSAEDAAADINSNVAALNAQWRAAGLTEQQISALNAQYGLTPEQIETALLLTGADKAKHTADEYVNYIHKIPSTVSTTVTAYAKTGGAQAAIDRLTYAKSVAITPYLTKSSLSLQIHASGTGYLKSAAGRFIPGGSNLLTTTAEIGGSRGDEVILPLGDRVKMASLLGMSEVGPRVAAAFGGTGGGSSGGGVMSTAVYNTVNATVNMPPGANGDDVVRSLRKLQRQSGPLPLVIR